MGDDVLVTPECGIFGRLTPRLRLVPNALGKPPALTAEQFDHHPTVPDLHPACSAELCRLLR